MIIIHVELCVYLFANSLLLLVGLGKKLHKAMSLITAEAAMTMSLIRGWKRSLKWIKSHHRHVTLPDTKAPTTRTSNPLVRFVTICCFEILCITTTTSSQVQTQSCSCDLTNQVGDESRWRVLKLKHERCSPTTLKTVWVSQNPLAWISLQRIGWCILQFKILLGTRKTSMCNA